MSVELEPQELGFRRPFNREITQRLFIKNTNYDPVAFKVKTTAPKQYCVRPNSGRIEAGREVEVQVLLQSMKEDPPAEFKCRDKFLVQSVIITADQESSNVGQIWQEVDKNFKSSIQEKKIRVQYLSADAPTPPNEYKTSSSPPPYSTSSFDHTVPDQVTAPPTGPVSTMDSRPEDHVTLQQAKDKAFNPATSGTVSETVTAAAASATQTVQEQLAEAKAQIQSLTSQLSDPNSNLRQKSVGELATDAKDRITAGVTNIGRTNQAPEGVPVQLAAALCLLAFLLAYFFF